MSDQTKTTTECLCNRSLDQLIEEIEDYGFRVGVTPDIADCFDLVAAALRKLKDDR